MFQDKEIAFLNKEINSFISKAEERLLADSISEEQRIRLESRLVTASSIKRKIEYEKKLTHQGQKKMPSVLVVDDMESALQINKQILLQLGFKEIETASNGDAGLKQMKTASAIHKPYGLVICDWEMPKKSGLDLLKEVRKDEELWATPFFLLSSRGEKSDILKAINIGVTGYITKPVNPATLKDKLKDYII